MNVTATKNALVDALAGLGAHVGLATGAPGTTATPANEASGGSYARVATTWAAASGGVRTGAAVIINAQSGTYTHGFIASAATGNTMIDNAALSPSIVLNAAGQIVVTPTLAVV
ncbi:phage tail fiber protein [Gordonia sp. DT219]|uniref:phage tail fiber protein n=1 Tax=Gordonia sp. DT219 TaxID=3416658 RepID=UPI003CF01B16